MKAASEPKTALVIIDVQSLLFDVAPLPFEGAEVIERINHLSAWARA